MPLLTTGNLGFASGQCVPEDPSIPNMWVLGTNSHSAHSTSDLEPHSSRIRTRMVVFSIFQVPLRLSFSAAQKSFGGKMLNRYEIQSLRPCNV